MNITTKSDFNGVRNNNRLYLTQEGMKVVIHNIVLPDDQLNV